MVKKHMQHIHQSERGVVSIFVVIFSALLITIVTVGFVQLMVRNQQEASTADLSESAYDSAMAGVEDAKRAIVEYNNCIAVFSTGCDNIIRSLDSNECSAVAGGLGENTSDYKGTIVGGVALNQSYTCAKVTLDTVDYIDELMRDSQHLVPLKGVTGFTSIEIEWAGQDDASESGDFSFGNSGDISLPQVTEWSPSRPAIIEVQLIQLRDNLDGINNDHRTLTLYPSRVGVNDLSFGDDVRYEPLSQSGPRAIACEETLTVRNYSCRARILVPTDIANQSFLKIATRYNSTNYRLSLLDSSGSTVRFDNVQPEADVTGRAGDVFRRVSARITSGSGLYPEAAVDISGNLCKTAFVTGHPDYYEAGECQP